MDPYLTPASRLRADAQSLENRADRATGFGEDYERAGNYGEAVLCYRRAARYLREAAAILRRAAEMEGGTQADLDRAAWFSLSAAGYDGYASGVADYSGDHGEDEEE